MFDLAGRQCAMDVEVFNALSGGLFIIRRLVRPIFPDCFGHFVG